MAPPLATVMVTGPGVFGAVIRELNRPFPHAILSSIRLPITSPPVPLKVGSLSISRWDVSYIVTHSVLCPPSRTVSGLKKTTGLKTGQLCSWESIGALPTPSNDSAIRNR